MIFLLSTLYFNEFDSIFKKNIIKVTLVEVDKTHAFREKLILNPISTEYNILYAIQTRYGLT